MRKTLFAFMILCSISSCTENERARKFGGSETIELKEGQKLRNVTFKENNLWILTSEFKNGEKPEVWHFSEKSNWHVWQGDITIIENKGAQNNENASIVESYDKYGNVQFKVYTGKVDSFLGTVKSN